jgi:hypothetical protein
MITLLANSRQNGRTQLSRATNLAIQPTKLGSCVDSVTFYEYSATTFRVFGRVDNERLSYAIAVIFGLRAKWPLPPQGRPDMPAYVQLRKIESASIVCPNCLALLWQILAIDRRNRIPESDFQ